MDNGLIPAKLLYALARKRKWGESHTAYENMLRQFKSEAFGKHGMKIVEGIAEEIIRFSEEPMTLWSDPSHVRFHGHSGVGFATQHCRMANLAPKCHADAMTLRRVRGLSQWLNSVACSKCCIRCGSFGKSDIEKND
ncbi:hypothetical protein COT30_01165 [Candidatus Micrarchaeota archaeon CG08_land_8_20_14_0_20_49_17]|nr:MAG: hypothetical protein COT30_01165 [Candidatus Micrarchaeota archaeon CG08_land_8_20_14_0_20_49_17]PIU81113.1 MAG: hypothetical protein COS70_05735 [Candidatus Micrarchaeota archaeon CG06_land_8_20_14_3_00_50_6]